VKLFRSHSPARIDASAAGIRRTSASSSANASSAAEIVLPLRAFITATPRSVHAATSMLSTPTPARPMTAAGRIAERVARDLRRAAHDQRVGIRDRAARRRH
jgi:hypothetical protein